MNILVIIGSDLNLNSSANLCHIAYLNGFDLNKDKLTVLTVEHENSLNENTMLPSKNVNYIFYKKGNFIDHLSAFVKNTFFKSNASDVVYQKDYKVKKEGNVNTKESFLKNIKKLLMNDIYYVEWSWIKRASKFKSKEVYDVVISLSTPHSSHKVACNLIEKKHINYKRYVQIWEDPWTGDLFFNQENRAKFENEENSLLSYATDIYYVSPVTYEYQKKKFYNFSNKMKWMPLPYYYVDDHDQNFSQCNFGYFGDFYPHVRNIEPLYNSFVSLKYPLVICGNPEGYLKSNDNISIYGRMPVEELKKYEDNTNVLVFVCNLYGGQIPGKIYQYSGTKKKILFILDGKKEEIKQIKDYFERFNRYYFCENNEESISNAINRIVENNDNVSSEIIEYFSPKKIVNNILHGKNESDSKE